MDSSSDGKLMTLLPLLLASFTAFAADPLYDATSAGTGGVGLADPTSVTATLRSPALGAQLTRMDLVALGSAGGETSLGGAIVDSATSAIALGVSLRWEGSTPPYTDDELPAWYVGDTLPNNRKSITDAQMAGSAPVGLEGRLTLGLSGTLARYDTATLGGGWTGNLGAGLALRASKHTTLAWALRNPLPTKSPRPAPLTTAIGARYAAPLGSIELDAGLRYDQAVLPELRAGGSVLIAEVVALRTGAAWTDHLDLCGGLGLQNETGGFGWSVVVPVSGGEPVHTFDLWVHGATE